MAVCQKIMLNIFLSLLLIEGIQQFFPALLITKGINQYFALSFAVRKIERYVSEFFFQFSK